MKRQRYKLFAGHPSRYHLTRIGESCRYDVPMYGRGASGDFSGKRISVVCVGSGQHTRLLMAGVVGTTPLTHLRLKKEMQYVFPEFGDHEIAYLGRRYMLIHANGQFFMPFYQGAVESIDPRSCDFILLDGKECCPIATLQHHTDGTLTGKLLEWHEGESFASVHEAVRGLAKKANAVLRLL